MTHILIVDDEAVIREGLRRVLEAEGYTTCWAGTGEGALRLMHSEHPDLILLDIRLTPEMSGWEVARQKLLDPSIRDIPVIIVSGLNADTIREGAVAVERAFSGHTLILGKPVMRETLLKAVITILSTAVPSTKPPPLSG